MVVKRNVLSQVELMPISDVSETQSNTDMSKLPNEDNPANLNGDQVYQLSAKNSDSKRDVA